jgi:hypothetical protein
MKKGRWSNEELNGAPTCRSTDSVRLHYEPLDSPTGYRRPPAVAGCVLDYFAVLGTIEDGGKFVHQEMQALIDDPDKFFSVVVTISPA